VVQRAWVIRALLDDPTLSATAAGRRAGFTREDAGPCRVRRFDAAGVDGVHDAPRRGRPPTHAPAVRDQLIALAVQKPAGLGEPFALWTLERLQRAFEERTGVHLSDSTIWVMGDRLSNARVQLRRPAPGTRIGRSLRSTSAARGSADA
jgi:hypothetical protein